ncbi:hypothetical protein D3C73_1453100 [compost metagenome]
MTRPELALRGFRKLLLQPGESRELIFTLGREQLELVGPDLQRIVEDGDFVVSVGSHSASKISGRLTVRTKEVQ